MLDLHGVARFAERRLMPDTVLVTREVGEDVLDPATGALMPAPPLVVHSGKAGLYGHQERIRSKGGHEGAWVEEVRAGYRLLLPLDAPELREGDMVEMVEARDEQAAGRTYRVAALGEVSSVPVLRTVWLEEHNRKADA
ncbi:hypothetical protein OEIGOIKO_03423 [Streptomyces chrestomyceticus JCM 4735]|uniref:Uncharacterized protein n=1 Tax=Streptomyces chrestomyceticus JCM 4735 TaxID=1306181 RepID=A0A7U9PWU5_9ACTN|nr:DUF6093 family protein [Streptomyces chrestomyceticus]GCD35677.1 hypothetical protein OEIGOIKO_03423 [Streptomyces chrestomyceticus JCM 4735]